MSQTVRRIVRIIAVVICFAEPAAAASTFEGLRIAYSEAFAVSVDGGIVVGVSGSERIGSYLEPLLWRGVRDFDRLGYLPGGFSQAWANGVSGDGSVVVGRSDSGNANGEFPREAFRWTRETGMVGLGDFAGGPFESEAFGVSADGRVIVGYGTIELNSAISPHIPARWTAEQGIRTLGPLPPGGIAGEALAITPDGRAIAGNINNQGFRWTEEEGFVLTGFLLDTSPNSPALAISADGSTVVGFSSVSEGREAYRWTRQEGIVGLGFLPDSGFISTARGVSGDGSVVVGDARSPREFFFSAFVWDRLNGMRYLQDVLVDEYGLGESLAGWYLERVTGITPDGLTLVGYGINEEGDTEGWIVHLDHPLAPPVPEPGSAALALVGAVGVLLVIRRRRR